MTPRTARADGPQLSLNVNEVAEAKRELADGTERELIVGTLKLGGKLSVPRDLDRREELVVNVLDLDGVVVATGRFTVKGPKFIDIEDHGHVIGVEREHTAKVIE